MDTKAKATSSSCLSFLKDALLLPTRNAKLFFPVLLLVTIPTFLLQIIDVFRIEPLTTAILLRIDEIKSMDPSSPDYDAKLATEIFKEARELAVTTIAVTIIALVCSFANQIVAFFAASTAYSGDRYSLSELFSKVIIKGRHLRGPLITVAMVIVLDIACVLLLAALVLLQLVMRLPEALYMAVLSVFTLIAFLYLNIVFAVAVAVSVADTECRGGVSALRQAWRLMTRVRRKEGCVLVVVILLPAIVSSPLEDVALGYSKKSMPVGLSLLFVDALLSGLVELFYFTAVMVYCYQAMESKEVMMAHDYAKIPTGEATV